MNKMHKSTIFKKNQKIFYALTAIVLGLFMLFYNINDITKYINNLNKNNSIPIVKGVVEEKPITYLENYKIPILMYHYIRYTDEPENSVGYKLSVSPDNFEEQMQWLKNHNFNTVGFDYLEKPYEVDFKPIIITFDDGYRDAYVNAYPILIKFNMKGVFYIITDSIGYPAYLTWEMIDEMSKNNMVFGSHTLSHPDLRKTNDDDLNAQLLYSKHALNDNVGINATDFCYPSGKFDEKTVTKLKDLGFHTSVTTKNGIVDENSSIFELPRIRIQENTNMGNILENY